MHKVNLLLWQYKSKVNKKGLAPIYLRITLNGNKTEVATGVFVSKENWDIKKGQVKGRDTLARIHNHNLHILKTKALEINSQLAIGKKAITSELIKQQLTGKGRKEYTLLDAYDYHLDKIQQRIGIDYAEGTRKKFLANHKKIKEFIIMSNRGNNIPL